jgi:MFS transporter, YNFM family, putative membrane transport protein
MRYSHQQSLDDHFAHRHRRFRLGAVSASTIPITISASSGHRAGTASYRRLIVAMMAGGLANFSLMYFVQPLLPLLADQYSVTPAESAHALSITTLTITVGLLMAGPLADRFGRVKLMRWSLVGSGLLGVATAFAPDWSVLLVLRGMLGVTLAWLPAAALAYLREEVHQGSHLRANAAYIAGTAVGGATGRLLPGPLAALGGWTTTALVMSLITVASGLALWILLPPAQGFQAHPVDLREMLLGTISAPVDKVLGWLCIAGFAAMGTFVGVYNAMAFRLQAAPFSLGHAASLVYLAYPIGISAPYLLRRMSDRIGRGHTTAFGAVLLVIAVAITSIPTLATVVIGLGLLTFAFLGVHSLLSGWVVDRAARQNLGTAQASSAYLLTYYLGSTFAGAVATLQWQLGGWGGVEVLTLALAGASVVAVLLASQRDRNPKVRMAAQPAHL